MRRGGRAADSPASETKLARRRAQKIIHPRARGSATRGDGGGPNSRFRPKSSSFGFERRRVGHIDRKGQYLFFAALLRMVIIITPSKFRFTDRGIEACVRVSNTGPLDWDRRCICPACFAAQSIRSNHPPSMRARPASPNGGSCNNFARITTLIHEYAPFITLFFVVVQGSAD